MDERRRQTRRRWLGTCAGVAGIAVLAGCSESDETSENGTGNGTEGNGDGTEAVGEDWPMYGVDLQNASYHPTATNPDGNEITRRAIFDLNGFTLEPVLVLDGILYSNSSDGKIYAVDDEGETVWETEKSGFLSAADGMIYGPTDDVRIHGYDAETGDHWQSDVIEPANGLARPLPTPSGILIPNSERIWRVDPETGEYTKVLDMPAYIGGSSYWPAFHDETLYTSRSSELHAVNVEAGEIEWTFEPENEGKLSESNPAVANGSVYVTNYNRQLHSVDADSGEEEWTVSTETRADASPAVADGLVYLAERSRVIAVDADEGAIEWEMGDELSGVPHDIVVAGDVCYVTSRRGIWAYDAATGELEWKLDFEFESDVQFTAPPTIHDGTVYVPSRDETLYALEDA
ncbi:PQQ-binding-like beta-propeller repeat protein [Halopiger goleimassiliensis]|uniref:PQQ-binding-like beta-propeller repeat protein n=1 Tax=Halopiger goleimassiliensis TaxID=1293048 RepID=UPI0006777D5B|nr:PQQ-binding-like beta-propeller repeat protein [Halopiger goleimassiliensis]